MKGSPPAPGPRIDPARCTGCGICVALCPRQMLTLQDGTATVVQERCMRCGHCLALCPAAAVHPDRLDIGQESYASFKPLPGVSAPGDDSLAGLVRLMRSRRSCRSYTERDVPENLLRDLVNIGITAPSGTNSQRWTFTLLRNREEMVYLGGLLADFFHRLNRNASRTWLRNLLALLGRPALKQYHDEHLGSVARALNAWEHDRRDLLFHGARAGIIVGSAPGASCPGEDALLATENILLAAHAMGLGTCLIGYAVEAMRHRRSIPAALAIPAGESIHAFIALGYPQERFLRPTGRQHPLIRLLPKTT